MWYDISSFSFTRAANALVLGLVGGDLTLITENYLSNGTGFVSLGVRFGSGRMRGTAGIGLPLSEVRCVTPIFSLVYVR